MDYEKVIKDATQVIGEDKLKKQVPTGKGVIRDQEAYDEWIRLKAHPLLTTQKIQMMSTGFTVNLGNFPSQFQSIIYALPEPEKKRLTTLREAFNRILVKANACQRRAYGTMVNHEGDIVKSSRSFNPLDTKRAELIELFGRMFTIPEVHAICLKEWKFNNVTKSQLEEWRQNNIADISIRIEEHKRSFSDIRLGYKRSRLEELTWLFQQRKTIYQLTKKAEDHRLLLDTLKAIKAESEGDLIRIEGAIEMNLDGMMHEHLGTEVFRYFPLQEIILARVAAKAGVSVANMLAAIEKGYYHSVLHIDAGDEGHVDKKDFPSTLTYDFDRISRMWKQQEAIRAIEPPKPTATPASTQTASDLIKKALLAKLATKNGDVNAARNTQAGYFVDKANKV